MNKVILSALALSLALAMPARADDADPMEVPADDGGFMAEHGDMGDAVARLDRDRDGLVSLGEFALPGERFSDFDRDGDGVIATEELDGRARGLAHFDADGDGNLTGSELAAGRAGVFARLDANGDGSLNRDEMGGSRNRFENRVEPAGNGLALHHRERAQVRPGNRGAKGGMAPGGGAMGRGRH